jgi:hypothetical protein
MLLVGDRIVPGDPVSGRNLKVAGWSITVLLAVMSLLLVGIFFVSI